MRLLLTISGVFVACALEAATLSAAPDILVVCPAEFRAALASWESYRRGQGHELTVIEPPASAEQLHTQIRDVAHKGRLKFVVLIGDVPNGGARAEPAEPSTGPSLKERGKPGATIPTEYVKANVNVLWGSEPTIATDQLYADVDGDGAPDVAVGRIPADTPAELAAVIRKVLRYEQQADAGLWRRHVNVVAGVGGFGRLADGLIEAAGRRVIESMVPASFVVEQTSASPTSIHCPPSGKFTSHVCRQLSDGSLAWIYLGHALPTALDAVDTPAGPRPILSVDDVPEIKCGADSPLAVLIACYTGAFDAPSDCLAEKLLLDEQGPVAAIAATRVTMPYGNTVLGCELLRACFADRPNTLGELFKLAQQRTLAETPDDLLRPTLDALAQALSPPPANLAAERREHVLMYQLFGDPLLRLKYPHELTLATSTDGEGGNVLIVEGQSDVAGDCTIELVRDRATESNDALAKTVMSVAAGPFRTAMPLPANAAGQYKLRAFVTGRHQFAAGATEVTLQPPKSRAVARAVEGELRK